MGGGGGGGDGGGGGISTKTVAAAEAVCNIFSWGHHARAVGRDRRRLGRSRVI